MRKILLVLLLAMPASMMLGQVFQATPLIDFQPGQLYLGKYPGFLYENNSNLPPADHEAEGQNFAAQVQPINGRIVVATIGMSNWQAENCGTQSIDTNCSSTSFIGQVQQGQKAGSVNPALLVVNCAQGGQAAPAWATQTAPWQTCLSRLALFNATGADVQVVLYKEADANPVVSLAQWSGACPDFSLIRLPRGLADVCLYQKASGDILRLFRSYFPNCKMVFMHSRAYAGYATTKENPEPYAYEYGFVNKWVIQAQIDQQRGLPQNATIGDISYSAAPWLGWGAYFWASDDTQRSDGLVWLATDFGPDGTHENGSGIAKVANLMMPFYLNSSLTRWFRP